MNYIEALTAMKEGKKVTSKKYLDSDCYICYNNEGELECNTLDVHELSLDDFTESIENLNEDCWEVYNEPILNEGEDDVLFNTLCAYKEDIQFVEKRHWGKTPSGDYECICFHTIKEDDLFAEADTYLPPFKAGTEYKGMKLNKEYSLEELKLFKELDY